ncbi:ATP-binding protein [Tamilnaduibacter salinus]|uniref:ATP-binding protein n=1 Tax=Tamilnaduibacter salinus TaxID=1484056 RepID=UPI001403B743|nr:ATP-binding protein [Tamilnaduibacter salinus]
MIRSRLHRYSIRAALLLLLLPLALAFMGVAWVVHGALLERMSRDFFEFRLEQESALIRQQLEASYPEVEFHRLHHTLSLQRFHHTFAIRMGDRTWSASEPMRVALFEATDGRVRELVTLESGGDQLLAYRAEFTVQGEAVVVVVAEDYGALAAAQGELHLWVGVVSFVLLLLLIILIVLAVQFAMRPVQRLRGELVSLRQGEQSRLSERVPSEFVELIRQLNAVLDTLDQRLETSRQSIANLSHSVKTPVSVLMQWLEDPGKQFDPTDRQQMIRRLRDLDEYLNAQMRRSRLSGPQVGQAALPVDQTRDMLWMMGRLHIDKQFDFEARFAPDTRWPVEEQDFNELLGNLVENAGKWADRLVAVWLSMNGEHLIIEVEDDGPGVPPEQREQLGTRGLRLDEQTEGHGLGLSIVRDIVNRYHGELCFGDGRYLCGLRVRIMLPYGYVD